MHIQTIIQKHELSQTAAGEIIGIDQSKVSKILLGKLRGFSLERLIRYVNALGNDVEIRIKPKAKNREKGEVRVHAARF